MPPRGASLLLLCLALALPALLLVPREGAAAPHFARRYGVSCGTCHVIPPKLNQFGEEFLARGYRFPGDEPTQRTWPFAVWATWRGQWETGPAERGRGLPNRVEIISGGPNPRTRAFYFLEWLPVSQQTDGNNRRVERHGRFEDLFVSVPLGRSDAFFTVGQFRALSQVDVSRRLSLSEPLAFATGVAGRPATTSRLTSLRSFSPSGRSPGLRVHHQWQRGARASDGWYNSATVPFAGELVIPLTERVHHEQGFAFEARPKGAFVESYYRYKLSSFGGHAFLGDDRQLYGLVGVYNRGPWFSTAALGFAHERNGSRDTRVSWENELVPWDWLAVGVRVDDRTGSNRPVAVIPHVNFEFPLTTYVVRITGEYRQQRGNRQWLLETGVVF
ncbi:MAG: hypothetical protein ACRD4U_08740 [Candidatus Acidiferrales bacterium]